jgi:hypothetical protein
MKFAVNATPRRYILVSDRIVQAIKRRNRSTQFGQCAINTKKLQLRHSAETKL